MVASEQDASERFFRTDHLMDTIGGRTARGGVVTMASHGLKFAISIIATAILAIGIVSRAVSEGRCASVLEFLVVVSTVTVGVMGRPPHVAFLLLLPLIASWRGS